MTPSEFCNQFNFPKDLVYAYLNDHIGSQVPDGDILETVYCRVRVINSEYQLTITDPAGLYSEICRRYRFPQLSAQQLYDLIKAALISDPSLKSRLL